MKYGYDGYMKKSEHDRPKENFDPAIPTMYDSEMVFCFKNCSDLLWEKNVLVIENLQNLWDHLNNLLEQ